MRNKLKRFISALTAAVMLLCMVPNVFGSAAEQFVDFPTGWSKPAMEAAVANGLLTGYDNNEIRPTANLTRAEFAAIIARAFGAKTEADISQYSDVSKDDWYYDYIAKVVKMGAMNGVSATAMNPDANITREEVFTAVARVLVLSDSDISGLSKFKDSAEVSSWATNSMSALAKRGYVNGDDLGNANPKANITREEFAQFMYNAIRTYITKSGTYDKDMEGIVVLRTGDVELKNLSITSDLVIGDGVLEDSVKITDVKVEKRLLTRGGTVTLKNTTLGENVVVNNVNGITFFKNYRDEKVFTGLVENTEAKFLTRPTGGGGGGGGGQRYITVTVDGESERYPSGSTIDTVKADTERLGYKYDWEDGQGNDIANGTVLTNGMVIVSNETLMQYPLSYFDEDGTTPITFETGYSAAPSFNIENKDTTVLPASANINKPGWKLVKWINMSTGADVPPLTVTADMTETDGVKLKAVFELIDFDIAFADWKVEGETSTEVFNAETMFTDAYKLSKAEKFNISVGIKDGKLLPANSDIKHPGYKFLKWVDKNGAEVTNANIKECITGGVVTESTTTLNLTAVFEVIDFNIAFTNWKIDGETDLKTFDDSMFVSGYQKAEKFNIVSGIKDGKLLPANEDISNPGYKFLKWVDKNGVEVTNANIKECITNGTVTESSIALNLTAVFEIIDFDIAFDKWMIEGETSTEVFNAETMFTDAYKLSKAEKFNISVGVKDGKLLPTNSDIKHLGYKFLRWVDKNGAEVTNANIKERITNGVVTESTATLNLTAVFEAVDFNIAFTKWKLEDGTESGDFDINWFASEYQKAEKFNIAYGIKDGKALPTDSDIENTGYELVKLVDESGAEVTDANIKDFIQGLVEGDKTTLNIVAVFKIKQYEIVFKHKSYEKNEDSSYDLIEDGDFNPDWFTAAVGTGFDIKNPYTLPLQTKVLRLGYNFRGWYGDSQLNPPTITTISVDKNTPDEKEVYAKFELIKYKLNFQSVIENADGTLEPAEKFKKDWFITSPQSEFDVRAPYELPDSDNIYRPGYTFLGWYDANNNMVTELTVNENTNQFGEKVYARFKMNNYTVNFYTGGDGSQLHKSYTYNILNYNGELEEGVTFADVHKSLALDNKVFVNWYELVDDGQGGLKQQLISGLTEEHLYKVDGTILNVYANTNDYAPLKIQFFKGYKQPTSLANEIVLLEEEQGGWYYNYHKTKFDTDINTEALKGSSAGLYDKSKYVDIYPSGSVYTVTPDFWYLKDGQFNPFEELFTDPDTTDDVDEYTIRVEGDPSATEEQVYENDGYLLYKNFGVMVNFGNLSYGPIEAIDIATKYSRTSRVADSVKVLGDRIGQWIERLKNYNPTLYNKLTGEVYEKMEEKDLIDEEQNIKITKIPMHIKNLVSLFTDKYDSLLDGDSFEITKADIPYILELEEDIKGMTFDDVIEKSNNAAIERLVNFIGKDTLSDAFERANDNYIAGLNEKIAIVEASLDPDAKETYTAYETFEIDVIDEILRPVYDKALPKAVEKLESIDKLKYYENDKLQYLVEHDVFEELLTYTGTTDPELTGYQIKDVIDYYNYVLGLFIVADDAICWYGDELTEEEFNAIRDAAFDKFYVVKDKIDEILADYTATGELPEQVENLLQKVQRINDLFLQMEGRLKGLINKYLNANLDNLDENQKAQYVIDVFFGEEEPTFTIDTLYAIFYAYDDAVQAKMQDALNSGKLQTAIAKFEASPFGKLFTSTNADESLLTLLTNIANNGVEQYKVANDDVTIQDVYKFVIAGNEFTLRRTYMKD